MRPTVTVILHRDDPLNRSIPVTYENTTTLNVSHTTTQRQLILMASEWVGEAPGSVQLEIEQRGKIIKNDDTPIADSTQRQSTYTYFVQPSTHATPYWCWDTDHNRPYLQHFSTNETLHNIQTALQRRRPDQQTIGQLTYCARTLTATNPLAAHHIPPNSREDPIVIHTSAQPTNVAPHSNDTPQQHTTRKGDGENRAQQQYYPPTQQLPTQQPLAHATTPVQMVRTLHGETMCIRADQCSNWEDLQHELTDRTGIPPHFQRLTAGGRVIQDYDTYTRHTDTGARTMHMTYSLDGGGKKSRTTQNTTSQRTQDTRQQNTVAATSSCTQNLHSTQTTQPAQRRRYRCKSRPPSQPAELTSQTNPWSTNNLLSEDRNKDPTTIKQPPSPHLPNQSPNYSPVTQQPQPQHRGPPQLLTAPGYNPPPPTAPRSDIAHANNGTASQRRPSTNALPAHYISTQRRKRHHQTPQPPSNGTLTPATTTPAQPPGTPYTQPHT